MSRSAKGTPRSRVGTRPWAGRHRGQGGAGARASEADSARSRGEPLAGLRPRAVDAGKRCARRTSAQGRRTAPGLAAPQAQAPPPPAGLTADTPRLDPTRRSPSRSPRR